MRVEWRSSTFAPTKGQRDREVDGQFHQKGTRFCLLKETISTHLTRIQSARLLPRNPLLYLFSQLTFSPSFPSLLLPACCAAGAGLAWDLISGCGANETQSPEEEHSEPKERKKSSLRRVCLCGPSAVPEPSKRHAIQLPVFF